MLSLGAWASATARGSRSSRYRNVLVSTLAGACFLAAAAPAFAEGYDMFSTSAYSTGEKPQSKLWYHDGSFWLIVDGPDGVAFYEKQGTSWTRGTFANAVLSSGGQADVKWNGSELFVLNYSSSSQLFKYAYDASSRAWVLFSGFPVSVPRPSGAETMVLEQDSTGRLWTTAEGGGNINVYYSTSADHRTWNSSPVVLQTAVNSDDICSIVAFGGNKVGVFWSDQNRDYFGFRVHNDGDAPGTWSSEEIIYKGSGHADDHINLAFDSTGRVYAITKDDFDNHAVHRRSTSGSWTTKTDVFGKTGTRGILMVAEADSKVYALYTRWDVSPDRIEYVVADMGTLAFGNLTTFISSSSGMNNVTGTKQILPPGCLIAVAENGTRCLYNSFGNPPGGGGTPPAPPQNLVATLAGDGTSVGLSWSAPTSGTPDGYDVYRSLNGGSYNKLNSTLVRGTTFDDNALGTGEHCYQVRAVDGGLQGSASNTACVDNTPALPPGAPTNLVAQLLETGGPGPAGAVLDLPFDEGTGQQAADLSGNGNHARLGTSTGTDSADPLWVAGVSGMALQFDGSNDFAEVADSPSLDPAGSFTVEAWARWNGGTGALVSKGSNNERTYRVLISSQGSIEFLWEIPGGSNREVITSSVVTDAAWHHVACVYDAAQGQNRIYLDGVLRASKSASGVPATNSKSLLVGAYLGTTSKRGYLNGAVDALHIVPGVLYTSDFTPSAVPATPPADALLAAAGSGDETAAQRVLLTWQAPTTGGTVAGYNVYRSVNGGAAQKLNGALVTLTSYNDNSLAEGELCYTVTAVGTQALEGSPSSPACVTVGTPPPPPPVAPTGLVAALQGTDPESALLQWTAPATGTPAAGYNVYRSVGGSAYQKINAALVAQTSFTDATLLSGSHCYQVAGVDALGQEGARSSAACVDYTPPVTPPPGAPQALTAQLVTTPGGTVDGVAAWAFDEGSGQSVEDATGKGHTGQLGSATGTDSADPLWGTGLEGGALVFDGTNDRVLVPDASDLHLAGSFTIEAWVQRGAGGTPDCILSKGDSQQRNFWLLLTSSGYIDFRWETSGGTNHGTQTTVAVTDNAWHHVAAVYDMQSGQDRIYLDGVLVKSASDTGTPATGTDPLYVGARLSSGVLKDWFVGSIDLARVSAGATYTTNFTPAQSFGGGLPRTQADLAWQPPASGTPAGYNVYRQVNGGSFARINAALVTGTTYADVSPPAGAVCYQVTAVDAASQEGAASDPACIGAVAKARAEAEPLVAIVPRILASPNPFNPATTIAYRLPSASYVLLTIYDVRGSRVATLVAGERAAGDHVVRWEGRSDSGHSVSSGAYFALLRAGTVELREKLILVK